jgi:excisionase family DNA binding protein
MLETQQPNPRRQRRYGNEEAGDKLDRLLSIGQARKILGISDSTARRLIQKGLLDAVHLSARCLRIRESSIKKLTGLAA